MNLKARFPHASTTFLKINGEIPPTVPQPDKKEPLGSSVPGKKESLGCPTVSFRGFSVRPQDPDNFTGGCKDLLDGLWRCGAIYGDAAWQVKTRYEQEKVDHFAQERIEIKITWPTSP